jgi:hypothetical protein
VKAAPANEPDTALQVRRWFDIKLVLLPGQPPFAKAYLGFAGNWVIERQLEQQVRALLERTVGSDHPLARTSRAQP